MALTAIGIGVAVAAGAEAGYSAKRGHDQEVQAKHAADQERQQQTDLDTKLAAQQKANQDRANQEIAYQRQRAVAIASGYNKGGTIKTSPLGVVNSPRVGGNTYLGAA